MQNYALKAAAELGVRNGQHRYFDVLKKIMLFISFIPCISTAASFDCRNSKTNIEKQICSNSELNTLDEVLGTLYRAWLDNSEDKESIVSSQKLWLIENRNICQNVSCLRESYKNRIMLIYNYEFVSDGTALGVGVEYVLKRNQFEILLNQRQSELVRLVKESTDAFTEPRLINTIENQYRSILEYRKSNCDLIGSLSGAGGSWPSTLAVKCEEKFTTKYYLTLDSAIQCLERMSIEQRKAEKGSCLYSIGLLPKE